MNNYITIHFCFIRDKTGGFLGHIDQLLGEVFQGLDFNWKLSEKGIEDAELVLVELIGKSKWMQEADVVHHINQQENDIFWEYLYGFRIMNDFVSKGCKTCGAS